MSTPFIFDIARGSFVDGPGIRTVVFLKGCPLNCTWCHNPESISYHPEISWSAKKCNLCNQCIEICHSNAVLDINNHTIDKSRCIVCGICVENCNFNAIRKVGKYYDPDQLTNILLRDKEYYNTSGGGVTFSGGEPLSNILYLEEVCSKLKEHNVNIAVQTCGLFDYRHFKKTLQAYIDIIYFDLKILDRQEHYKYTSRFNDKILENLYNLQSEKKQKIIVRTPLIPLITDTQKNLSSIKSYIKNLNIDGYELLEYNPV